MCRIDCIESNRVLTHPMVMAIQKTSHTVETPAGNARYCRHLLATLWQPLLLRLLTLAITLTPPQVRVIIRQLI